MNREQFANWKDFALRMAKTYPGASKKTRAWLERMVHDAIDTILSNVSKENIVDWDKNKSDDESISGVMREWCWANADVSRRENDNGTLTAEYNRWYETYGNRLKCCIRAGLDMATTPGGGVVGFDVGDLKRMYPEGIPAWISAHFQTKHGKPVDLNRVKDKEGVWL